MSVTKIFFRKIITWFYRVTKGLNNMIQLSGNDTAIKLWSEDYKLLEYEGLFEEYLEMGLKIIHSMYFSF